MDSIRDMEALQECYNWQYCSLDKHIKEEIRKYIYGKCLDRFLLKVVTESEEIIITEEEQKVLDSILDDYNIVELDNGEKLVQYKIKKSFNPPKDYEMNPHKARREYAKLAQQLDIQNDSAIMMLLVRYENCISGIYRFLLNNYPKAYLSNKSITYTELIECSTDIESIKAKFVEKEVDEFMRMPLSDWYKTFESKHKANFNYISEEMKAFREIYYRRNIIVHNQGIANDIYVLNSGNKNVEIGDRLIVDNRYINSAFEITVKVLIGTLWGLRKLADDKENICDELFDYGYRYLLEEKWELAKFINGLLLTDEDQSAADIMCERVNRWIAIKNLEGVGEINDEVNALDVSAMGLQFVIAKYALLDDFQKVSYYLEKAINDVLKPADIKEWPLLKQYRDSELYHEFVEKHASDFEIQGYANDDETEGDEDALIAKMECQLDEES